MNIKQFLTDNNIPNHLIYYYISDTKKTKEGEPQKIPIGEKNNTTIDEIVAINENHKTNQLTIPQYLSSKESESLVLAHSCFLKYADDLYCIDIDDKTITEIDDLQENHYDLYNVVMDCAWVKGNTKGIHIYTYIKNIPKYTNQQNSFIGINGDLIKKNNMWEACDKLFINPTIQWLDYNIISHIFSDTFKKSCDVPKQVTRQETAEQETTKQETTEQETVEINNVGKTDKNQITRWLELGIEYKIFKSIEYDKWISLGYIIKNELGHDGENYFIELSRNDVIKFDESHARTTYKHLNESTKKSNKLSFKSLFKFYKDEDEAKYKAINDRIKIENKQGLLKRSSELKAELKRNHNELRNTEKGTSTDFDIDESKKMRFSTEYFMTLKKYAHKKKYFEFFVCMVLRPNPVYVYSEVDNCSGYNCLLYTKQDIVTTFGRLKSGIHRSEEGETIFIKEWLSDENALVYNNMDFIPYNGIRDLTIKNEKNMYNLFNGYNPTIETPYNKTKQENLMKPFMDLLLQLCGNNESDMDYFIDFLSHIIQMPAERIPVAFIFKSKEGCGKNVMMNAFANILGHGQYISSSNFKDFFSDYAEGFYLKLLVNLNEMQCSNHSFDYQGQLKSFITEPTITINQKFVRMKTVSNYSRVVIFTNKNNPLPIDVNGKDRRYVVYQGTDEYLKPKYGRVFWKKAVEHFNKPETIACMYDFFNTRDISKRDWTKRPITKAYVEMCRQFVPIEAQFMDYFIEKQKKDKTRKYEKQEEYKSIELYEEYMFFCQSRGFSKENSYFTSVTKFNAGMVNMDVGMTRTRTSETYVWRFCMKSIYDVMVKRKWIMSIETDNDLVEEEDIGEDFTDYFV